MFYGTVGQDEIMFALWSQQSVQLITATLWDKGEVKTFLIVSDATHKDKNTVALL